MSVLLRRLELSDREPFLRAVEIATQGLEKSFAHYYEPGLDFARYVEILRERSQGLNLPEGHVPSDCLFGFAEGELVGRLSVRHCLNPLLETVGGHIGYVVLAPYRRRGYATEMLRQSLEFSRALGLERVLVTCNESNLPSRRTIEKCGGVYENSFEGPGLDEPKRRYWIGV